MNKRQTGLLKQDMKAWERHIDLPQDFFRDGSIVVCEDKNLAVDISEKIRALDHADSQETAYRLGEMLNSKTRETTWRVDCSLMWRGAPGSLLYNVTGNVEFFPRTAKGLPPGFPPTVEHVLAIKRGPLVASWVSNIPHLKIHDHWIHSLRVETRPEFRRQGLGKAVVSALLEHIAEEDGSALWVCKATNIPSLSLALSLGFVLHFVRVGK